MMRAALCILSLSACGGAQRTAVGTACRSEAATAPQEDRQSESRIRELEARVALRTSEIRELESRLAARDAAPPQAVVRIGRADAARPDENSVLVEEMDRGPRPLLRIHGPSTDRSSGETAAMLPTLPTAVPLAPPPLLHALGRLPDHAPVPPIPSQPMILPPEANSGGSPVLDATTAEYQRALARFEARDFEGASAALDSFVRNHPAHDYADNALYWRGEIAFLLRQLPVAIALFDRLLDRYPSGNKVPDALARIAECHRRLGHPERATAYLERLMREFPNSVAARSIATREET